MRPIILAVVGLLLAGCSSSPEAPATTTSVVTTTTTPSLATTTHAPATTTSPSPPPPPSASAFARESGQPCDPARPARFTSHVTGVANISYVMPPGNIVPGGVVKSHGYVAMLGEAGTRVPVYAPAASTVFRLAWYVEEGAEQWLLFLQADCDTWYVFDHLDDVSTRIRAVAPAAPSDSTASNNLPAGVAVAAGEQLGWAHARGSGGAFDFGAYDSSRVAPFANVSRHPDARDRHAICPFDLFPDDMASAYTARFARAGGEIVAGASCRGSSRDVDGTLAGQWYKADGAALAVAADLDGSVVVSAPGVFLRQEAPATDPETVAPGQSVCYADASTHASFTLASATRVQVSAGPGPCPASGGAGEAWER